jgi:hypothetical protein
VVSKGHALPTSFFPSRLTSPCASLCFAGIGDPTVYCIGGSSSASGGTPSGTWCRARRFFTKHVDTCKSPIPRTSEFASVLRPSGSTGRPVASFFRLLYCPRERLGLLRAARRLAHVTHGGVPLPLTASVAGRRPDMLYSFLRMGVPNSQPVLWRIHTGRWQVLRNASSPLFLTSRIPHSAPRIPLPSGLDPKAFVIR